MKFFNFKNYNIEYEVFGKGKSVMLAFHGFGQHSSQFKAFENSFGLHYKIISVNLFFHGKTHVNTALPKDEFSKADLKELLDAFVNRMDIKQFSLLAYSLGGKIALCCIELFPEKILDVFLFAPDGLKINPWYFATSHTQIGRNVYKKIIDKPEFFLYLLQGLKNTYLLSKKMHKFIEFHLESRQKRKLVYDVWIVFRNLNPDLEKLKIIFTKYPIYLKLFFGKYDIIIPPKIGEKFSKSIKNPDSLHVVPLGHRLITEELNPFIAEILKNKKDAR